MWFKVLVKVLLGPTNSFSQKPFLFLIELSIVIEHHATFSWYIFFAKKISTTFKEYLVFETSEIILEKRSAVNFFIS